VIREDYRKLGTIMLDVTRHHLTFLIEKAHRIRDSKFLDIIQKRQGIPVRILFEKVNNIATMSRSDIDQDAVEGFILNFRFFYDGNEAISFKRIPNIIDRSLSEHWKKETKRIFIWFEEHKNEATGIESDNNYLTRGQIIDIFLYGDLSHGDYQKRIKFKEWSDNPFGPILQEGAFYNSLIKITEAIGQLANLAKKELENNPPKA
jgi:hypothetical protein